MERWARFVARHPRRVLIGWVLLIVLGGLLASRFAGQFTDTFNVPATESQRAYDLLVERFPQQSGSELRAVFHTPQGRVDAPQVRAAIAEFRRDAAKVDEVVRVSDPFESPSDISRDGRTAIARVVYEALPNQIEHANIGAVFEIGSGFRSGQLQVEFGGEPAREYETEPPGLAEIVGIGAALVILIIGFGSIFAAGMPIISALVGLALGTMTIILAASVMDITTFAPQFGAMLGIGVGIDYALFVISRYREQLAGGSSVEQAVRVAISTAGRAVAFAGSIVVVALLGLFAIDIPLIANLGFSAAIVVFIEMLVAVSLLPALLKIVGPRIDRFSIPGLRYTAGGERGLWYRFSRRIERRPWLYLIASTALLLVLAAPVLSLELGVSDDGNRSDEYSSRRAYDLIADAFGPGVNGTLIAVVDHPAGQLSETRLRQVRSALAQVAGVASVSPPRVNAAGDTAVLMVIPTTAPQDRATRQLVTEIRASGAPAALAGAAPGVGVYLTGSTAAFEDITTKMVSRLPYFFLFVVGVSILVLMMAFRSIVVPLKAAILNMLAIGASLGFIIAIFQWGWGLSLLGLDRTGPIESFLPLFMFAILFGLSMDYEVFLLSRVRERWLATRDPGESVAYGIGASARVITAAAAILIAVFGSFAFFGDERAIKEFGIGMAFAIFIDATLVRLVLVPAFMQLAGGANWYLPPLLDRILPNLTIDPPVPATRPLTTLLQLLARPARQRSSSSTLR